MELVYFLILITFLLTAFIIYHAAKEGISKGEGLVATFIIFCNIVGIYYLSEEYEIQNRKLKQLNYYEYITHNSDITEHTISTVYTTEYLNLRKEASSQSKILHTFEPNQRLIVESRYAFNKYWFKIRSQYGEGFVHGKYIRPQFFSEKYEKYPLVFDQALNYLFPKKNIQTSLLFWLSSFPVSVLCSLFSYKLFGLGIPLPFTNGQRVSPDIFCLIIPIFFYTFSNDIFLSFNGEELMLFFFIGFIVSIILSVPSTMITTKIAEGETRYFPYFTY